MSNYFLLIPKIDFQNTFSPDIFKSIIKKRIFSLEIAPILLRIHYKEGAYLSIHSRYSTINLKKATITFKRKVWVRAGPNILSAKELTLIPERRIYQVNSPFVLKTDTGELRGDYLEIDIFLNQIITIHTDIDKD